jgi:hypothetical protein
MEYVIQLEDDELDVMTLRGLFSGKNEKHPFFFVNACDIGQAHHVVNFVDGWAPAVLEGGASGYIGGLWSLGDKGAAEFATRFYQLLAEELESGAVTIADVLQQTRKQFYENGDPTFLAYVYYGDPDFRFTQPQPRYFEKSNLRRYDWRDFDVSRFPTLLKIPTPLEMPK